MSYGIVFRGTYGYADEQGAIRALEQVREELAACAADTDAHLVRRVSEDLDRLVVRTGASVRIEIDEYGPPGLFPLYELVVEVMAEPATSGEVSSRMEGDDEEAVRYPAGSAGDEH